MKIWALAFFTIFLSSLAYGSDTEVVLPKPTGIYKTGTTSFELTDTSRNQFRGEGKRRFILQAFYPTDLNQEKLSPYMPGTLERGDVDGIKVLAHSKEDTKISSNGPFPVVLFQHGLGGYRQKHTIICEEMASHGYVVLSLDQPYMSNFVKFKDGSSVVPTFYDSWKVMRDRDYRYAYYDEAMETSIEDMKYVLDQIGALNKTLFSNALDNTRIAVMGHSFGGNVAHTLGFEDARIKAVVDVDSKITERKIYGRIGVPPNTHAKPVLFLRGALQYQEDVGDQLETTKNARVLNFQVEHSAFSDKAYLVHKIPSLNGTSFLCRVWRWFWKKGPHFDEVDTDLGAFKPDNWYATYRKSVIKFLNKKLKA